jgi:hypothetical protein
LTARPTVRRPRKTQPSHASLIFRTTAPMKDKVEHIPI